MSSKLPWILEKQRIRSRMEERVFTRGSKRKREVLVRAREGEFRGSWRSLPICINTCPRATSWWEHDSYPERNRGGGHASNGLQPRLHPLPPPDQPTRTWETMILPDFDGFRSDSYTFFSLSRERGIILYSPLRRDWKMKGRSWEGKIYRFRRFSKEINLDQGWE